MKKYHQTLILLAAVAIGLVGRSAHAQIQVNRCATCPSQAQRVAPSRSFTGNILLLPSEQRFVVLASGLLPSEIRDIRFRIGALPSEGIAPQPTRGVALRYPSYAHYWRMTADPLAPAGLPEGNIRYQFAGTHGPVAPTVAAAQNNIQLSNDWVTLPPESSWAPSDAAMSVPIAMPSWAQR